MKFVVSCERDGGLRDVSRIFVAANSVIVKKCKQEAQRDFF